MDYRKLYDGIDPMRVVLSDAIDKTQGLESKSVEQDLREFRDRVCEAMESIEAAQRELIRLEVEATWDTREEAKK